MTTKVTHASKTGVKRILMSQTNEKVGPLKKITLSWEAGSGPDGIDLTSGSGLFEFIYNLGPWGLSPFEYELAGKAVGDSISIRIKNGQVAEILEHLEALLPDLPRESASLHLRFKVLKITPADPGEVIKAMAETASCKDHCCGH